jgi:hypothetical protein
MAAGLGVARTRVGLAKTAVAAEQTERYTPLVMESLEPWRRAVDGWLDPQKYPLANKFLREFPQELALAPGGVLGFKATLLEAASRGDTKAMGELAESMARPFYPPVQSFRENPTGTVLMWAMVGGTYAERLRGQVRASNEVERRALEAFGDMMQEQQAAPRLQREARAIQARAAARLSQLQTVGQEVAEAVGGRLVVGPVKGIDRMVQKAWSTHRRDPSAALAGMKDVLRASLVVPDLPSYEAAARELARRAVAVDSSLLRPKTSGYQGFHVTIDLGGGVLAEVQLHTEATYALTHGAKGTHGAYEGVRELLPRDQEELSPSEQRAVLRFHRENRARYTVALGMPKQMRERISSLRSGGGPREQ